MDHVSRAADFRLHLGKSVLKAHFMHLKNYSRAWGKITALFLIPIIFMLLQLWASHSVIRRASAGPLTDGVHYITQARDFQFLMRDPASWSSKLPGFLLEYSLYPVFLSGFDFSELRDWSTASTHPQVLAVSSVQALLLAISTALFLLFSFKLVAGHPLKRIAISVLLGGLLLSPLVVVWPLFILTESVTLSVLLVFVCACLAYEAKYRYSIVLIGLACCLLVLIRNPMIFFVWVFAGLLGTSILFARTTWTRPVAVGALVLVLAVGLGGARASFLSAKGTYVQTLVQIIQFRILPDPERRAFFADHGMPTTTAVMERSGKPAWLNNSLFLPDSELDADFIAYRNWVVANGNRTYAAFLLRHPGYLLRSLVSSPSLDTVDYNQDFHFTITDIFSIPVHGDEVEFVPYPPWLRHFLLAPLGWVLPALFLVLVVMRYVSRTGRGQLTSALEIGAMAAGASIFVSYHTDAWDLWRHTIPFVLLIYISMILRTVEIGKDIIQFARRRLVSGATAGERSAT